MSVRKLFAGLLFSGISLLALSGCAVGPENNNPTQLTAQWVDPAATFEQKTITGLFSSCCCRESDEPPDLRRHRLRCLSVTRDSKYTELPCDSSGL